MESWNAILLFAWLCSLLHPALSAGVTCDGAEWRRSNVDDKKYYRYFKELRMNLLDAREACQECVGGDLATLDDDDKVEDDISLWKELLYVQSEAVSEPHAWIGYKNDYSEWRHGRTGTELEPDSHIVKVLEKYCGYMDLNLNTRCNTGTSTKYLYAVRFFADNSLLHVAGTDSLKDEKPFMCEKRDAVPTDGYTGTGQTFGLNFDWENYLGGGQGDGRRDNQKLSDFVPTTASPVYGVDTTYFYTVTLPVAAGIIVVIFLFLLACKLKYEDDF